MTTKFVQEEKNPTTRMYPRTLDEAFPNDISRAEWFYPPEKNLNVHNIAMGLVALCFWVCIAFIFTAP
jgi:hypothetical protein